MKRITTVALAFLPVTLFAACSGSEVVSDEPVAQAIPGFERGLCDSLGQGATKDSIILDNVFIYRTYLEQGDTSGAMSFWRYVYNEAPGYDEGVYTQGLAMFKTRIRNEQDSAQRELLIDTLLMIWDKRMHCFGNPCKNIGRKALDMVAYRRSAIGEITMLFDSAMSICGNNPETFVIQYWISLGASQLRQGKLTCDDMLSRYDQVLEIIKAKESEGHPHTAYYKQLDESTVNELTKLGCMDCEKLVPIFSKRLANDPENPELWEQAWSNLKTCKDDCNDTILAAFDKLLDAKPSADLARWLYACMVKQERYTDAIPYAVEAVELEVEAEVQGSLNLSLAQLHQKLGEYSKARQYAYDALKAKPGWGQPYILIGNLYASSQSRCDDIFNGKSVVWAAIDKWEKAKGDPETAGKASSLISKYWAYMPLTQDLFYQDVTEGSSYTVGCWIQETTTVRASD